MLTKVIVPQKGLSDESCIIQEWKKKERDRVEKGEIICEVETNKAIFEIEAPVSGIILKILHQEGEEVPVLDMIAIIGEPGEEYAHLSGQKETRGIEKLQESEIIQETVHQDKQGDSRSAGEISGLKISPRAHRLALENKLDISGISGSGPDGRIIERDVMEAISTGRTLFRTVSEKKEKRSGIYQEITVKGIRKVIAGRMFQSLQSTAQLTLHSSFQARRLLDYRSHLKESPEQSAYRNINLNHLIMFGIIKALKDYPNINSHYQDGRIIQFKDIHLGFAVDTEEGLKVPVVHQAEQYPLELFAQKVQELTQQCIDRSIQPDSLEGGTFTVTNLGSLGIEFFTPILNLPQTAILGIGCSQTKPVFKENTIEFAPYMGLSLTFDHRVIDGAPAARFLQQVIKILEHFAVQPHQKP